MNANYVYAVQQVGLNKRSVAGDWPSRRERQSLIGLRLTKPANKSFQKQKKHLRLLAWGRIAAGGLKKELCVLCGDTYKKTAPIFADGAVFFCID